MELVYLWVEEYKNIKNQGFNFSSKYNCEFKDEYYKDGKLKDNCKLIIKENDNYIENFFGENINITAIVGKNGSGKSSIFDSITLRKKIFILVYDNELKIYTRNININSFYNEEKLSYSFLKNILYYSTGNEFLKDTTSNLHYIHKQNTIKFITKNYSELQNYKFNIFNFTPKFIYFEFKYNLKLIDIDEYIDEEFIQQIKRIITVDSDILITTLQALQNYNNNYINYLLFLFGNITDVFEQIDLTEYLHPKDNYLTINSNEIIKVLDSCNIPYITENDFNKINKYKDNNIKISNLKEKFGSDYANLLFRDLNNILDFDFFSNNGASFNSLSDGEKTIYTFLVNLIEYKSNNFLFILDEPDNTLHPQWQKKFIDELIKILNKLNKKVHILITTHSPFMLSDLPKQNIIFLDKNEDGTCKVVDGLKDKKQTFGANIHTLLSDSFFMEDGLMGEFAKGKIDEVIKLLNQNKLSDKEIKQCEQIISIIGEPIIKNQLEKMLHNKKIDYLAKDTKDEIKLLKQRIDLLSKRL